LAEDSDTKQTKIKSREDQIEFIGQRTVDVCEVFSFLISDQMYKCRKTLERKGFIGIGAYKKEDVSDAEEAIEVADDDAGQAEKGTTAADETMEQPLNHKK